MNLPEFFRQYLKSQKTSSVTTKNYVADFNNFLTWLAAKTGIKYQVAGRAVLGLFSRETIEEYKTDLLEKNTPPSTINRRLSALRKFGQFAQNQGWIKNNSALEVENIIQKEMVSDEEAKGEVLNQFKKHLEKEQASRLTIKNYLSDLRHFLDWLEPAT